MIASLVLLAHLAFSQEEHELYNIKDGGRYKPKKCESYNRIYKKLPADFRYTVELSDGLLYFIFPSYDYFRLLFNKRMDGIAVDIVSRDQYDCASKSGFSAAGAFRGELLKPMYRRKMLNHAAVNELGYVYVEYAEVPEGLDPGNVEFNLVVLQKRYVCGYHAFSNLDFYNWELLETGLYYDSIPKDSGHGQMREISKTLEFVIPFAKDRTYFDAADLRPLYDSLQLTDYDIREINIRAYASVEGSHERNLQLQEGRAASIVEALQTFQRPEISSGISTNENWVEFLNDLHGTKFAALTRLSQEEVKARLAKDAELLASLEPLLSRHRKALVELKLAKRFTDEQSKPTELRRFFEQAIAAEDRGEALYLQQLIFSGIRNHRIPETFLEELEVPATSLFGPLHNNIILFDYGRDTSREEEAIEKLKQLLELIPGNPKVEYNLAALSIQSWVKGTPPLNSAAIRKMILGLERKGIDKSLTRRLLVNYEIFMTEYFDLRQDVRNKNRALREVYSSYKSLDLSDEDRVSLAKFLSFYSQFGWAENVLYPRIRQVDASEELLFYYLQLTISNRRKTRHSQYKILLLNAIDKNHQRFCDIFLSRSRGGFTFQLLDDVNLRKIYCESCGG